MVNSKTLTSTLAAAVGLGEKTGSALTPRTDVPTTSEKLQDIVGTPIDPKSTFAQINRGIGNRTKADANSPLQGDDIFFTYLMAGAQFQDKNGDFWEIDTYDWEGMVEIHDPWHPRRRGIVSVQDIRRSIYAWTSPVQQVVPPAPQGIDYGVVETRSVD